MDGQKMGGLWNMEITRPAVAGTLESSDCQVIVEPGNGKIDLENMYDAMAAEQSIQGKSAVDFCMAIQGQYPELIKIIMTDYITKELVEAKERKVIDESIDKPVSDAAILGAVKRGREERKVR